MFHVNLYYYILQYLLTMCMCVYCNMQKETTEELNTLQKRCTQLSQDKDKVEAEKMQLEQQLSHSSKQLSHFNKELQRAQDDDITMVCSLQYVYIFGMYVNNIAKMNNSTIQHFFQLKCPSCFLYANDSMESKVFVHCRTRNARNTYKT